jgi:plastocyanin
MHRRAFRAAVVLAAVCAIAGPPAAVFAAGSGPQATPAAGHTVTLKNIAFNPRKLTIRRGETVTWQWRDGIAHNVTFRGFHSRTQQSGSYSVRFAKRGTYAFHCTIHHSMTGTITVN